MAVLKVALPFASKATEPTCCWKVPKVPLVTCLLLRPIAQKSLIERSVIASPAPDGWLSEQRATQGEGKKNHLDKSERAFRRS
jgi:hypothetical protein